MSLTSENLVGYMRAEFAKSGRIRVWLFFVQLAAAVPAAVSVVIPDQDAVLLYALAILAIVLLIAWWVLNEFYVSANSAAQAARRAALLLGGLNQPLSPSEIQNLRERFTVTSERSRGYEKADYYATKEPHGPARLAEMIEESAIYSEHLQRKSGQAMLGIMLIFALIFLIVALVSIPTIERDTGLAMARVMLSLMVFVLSADMLGAWRLHRAATEEIVDIRKRLMVADRAGYPMPDVLLAFSDYNSAVEGCPESVPFVYDWYQKELEQRWNDYQADRAAARVQWRGTAA
jgi:hypothetical protein